MASPTLGSRVNALAAMGETTFVAVRSRVLVFVRGKQVRELQGHGAHVTHLHIVGTTVLLTIDKDNKLFLWDLQTFGALSDEPQPLGSGFRVTCLVHPATYLNKVLIGTSTGVLLLWNFKTGKLIHKFDGWGSLEVTCIAQSPALDVLACGLSDGRIVLHNFKVDQTICTLRHAGACVTSVSFRTDPNASLALMVSGDTNGQIAVWDLEKTRMVALLKHAHRHGGVASVAFLAGEPVMLSSGSRDNSVRMWIFDVHDQTGTPRLLRERTGHSAPPAVLLFKDEHTLLSGGSDGAVRTISIIQDHRSTELSQKNLKKATQGQMVRFAPVIALSYSETRRKEWDCIVSAHAGMASLWAWNTERLARFPHIPPHDKAPVRSCAVTRCGNFAIVGTNSGTLHRVNLQSGRWYNRVADAHKGSIEGVCSDVFETTVVTCGLDGMVRFWSMEDFSLLAEVNVGSACSLMSVHWEGGLVAVCSDDWCVRVFDIESRQMVRNFQNGHHSQITAVCFSGDSKWVLSASADGVVRTWDIVSAHCVDAFQCPKPVVAMAFSPKNDLLATAHVDDVGVFVWSNRAHYQMVFLRPVTDVRAIVMPQAVMEGEDGDEETLFFVNNTSDRAKVNNDNDVAESGGATAGSSVWQFLQDMALPNKGVLVQLSGEPESKMMALVHVDEIKERNKPKEPVAQPIRAPFVLPTVPGVNLQFVVPESSLDSSASHVLPRSLASKGPLSKILLDCSASGDWAVLATRLRGITPSACDAEIRLLSVEGQGHELNLFMSFLVWSLELRSEFDLTQGYIYSFLQAHGETIMLIPALKTKLQHLLQCNRDICKELDSLLQRSMCSVQLALQRNAF